MLDRNTDDLTNAEVKSFLDELGQQMLDLDFERTAHRKANAEVLDIAKMPEGPERDARMNLYLLTHRIVDVAMVAIEGMARDVHYKQVRDRYMTIREVYEVLKEYDPDPNFQPTDEHPNTTSVSAEGNGLGNE